jgi:hypothetical protein
MQPIKYPASLQPTTTEPMTLPSGRSVGFPKATPTFAKWRGKPVDDDYNGKPILDFAGSPAFAEVVILRTLESAGWQGVWVDTYRSAFRTESWESVSQKSLPQKPNSLPQEIWDLAKIRAGVWDVFCWQDDRVLFCESKRAKKDAIRESQLLFAESALNTGLPLDSLLFVEWKTDSGAQS